MNLLKLGYTSKWLEYNFINEETLSNQIAEFEQGEDQNAGLHRYATFTNWLAKKEALSNEEVIQFIELAQEDADDRMSGSAIKDLFVSPKISDEQFEIIKLKLPEFGEWTQKLITREVLTRRLENEELTPELFKLCLDYKKKHKDNRLLTSIIKRTDNIEILSVFEELKIGKHIKKMAKNRMGQLGKV